MSPYRSLAPRTSSVDTNPRRILAKKRSKCFCGSWVYPGQAILWDTRTRKTCGCAACNPRETEEHPDPGAYADDDPWWIPCR